ncbi:hypothetical protein CcaverHIS002_0202500 [Cutaneotrichosporon cavernicola]|uniref:Ricin B lectin domain-containing protein n=1 Tax=Cutaneotrichosporon cavernicola TaxID=279322 RepID=A0AA48I886_9TREE|nr:uncharacterized protein CcaverHIS019_0202520 [Cutaneotrichosporon cavernicola]BEI81090.1 hypothetical protein CcaverHIS002_0202500 [Cutaneotrichosporon cavernicola]BEI88890.1 hypothetical protein CcaverHIS019_0202520 [Cutaneotrichosporon cavernicola]BEI96667.1 hypothetical protein CcaverHIS631_0202560 [Cutaneotrichosporon cavernicola]BEJ04438.1 hypothetical protein CcaverHIS641_0202550 [Cutaneotrichosporon cavernicola]
MVAFTTLLTVLASTAALAAPHEPRAPTQIQSRVSNTRVGNLCIGPGGTNGEDLTLMSCSDKNAEAQFSNSQIVMNNGVAEVQAGMNIIPWVHVRPATQTEPQASKQRWTMPTVEGYVRFQATDWQCLTVGDVMPGPAKLLMEPCRAADVNQDFMLI